MAQLSVAVVCEIRSIRRSYLRKAFQECRDCPITFRRSPENASDKNACVAVQENDDIGFLQKEVAAVVSPYIDSKDVTLIG